MEIVSLESVTKVYKNKVKAVSNVNLIFESGKFYGISGDSGSGKSTLLNIIGTLDKATSGSVTMLGKNVSKISEKERVMLRRNTIGFVFQSFMLNPKLKAYENVMLSMLTSNKAYCQCKKDSIQLLDYFGLNERTEHFPFELSGGEQQRVSIARALANSPKLILADEPTGNLDNKNELKVFEHLSALAQKGCCVIIVSHNKELSNYANHIITMKSGEIYET